jgi:hypothetical protein
MYAAVGLSMIDYTTRLSIGFYFSKYRNLAYGLALSGAGLGTIIYPLFLEYLFETYGQRGSLLIIAGVNLHSVIAGVLTRLFKTGQHAKNQSGFADKKPEFDVTVNEKENGFLTYEITIENNKMNLERSENNVKHSANANEILVVKQEIDSVEKSINNYNMEKESNSYHPLIINPNLTNNEKNVKQVEAQSEDVKPRCFKALNWFSHVEDYLVFPFLIFCLSIFLVCNGVS